MLFFLFQDPFLDDFIHVCARKVQPGVKTPLDLGKVVPFHVFPGNSIDIRLGGHNDPGFPPELGPKFLDNGLEVEHQLAVFPYILPHFVHKEDNLVAFTF